MAAASAFLPALAAAGSANVASGLFSFLGAREQRKAAEEASRRAARTGRETRDIIARTTPQARAELQEGFGAADARLRQVGSLLSGAQDRLAGQFEQERQVGQQALQRLQQVILGGDISQLQFDPGFEFRRQEGERAIERAAAAAGSFGGGGNLRDFARFNQGLASQEFGAALARLGGLQQIGSQANLNFAQLNQGLIGQRAQVGQNLAQVAQNRGSALAQLTQSAAANQANALNNTAATINAFNLQAANAQAQGLGAIGGGLQNAGNTIALAAMLNPDAFKFAPQQQTAQQAGFFNNPAPIAPPVLPQGRPAPPAFAFS